MPKPWACQGDGVSPCPESVLGIHDGLGRLPTTCPACRQSRRTRVQRARRDALAAGATPFVKARIQVDPEPSEGSEESGSPARRYTGMSLAAGPKRGRLPLDLTGCPDPATDLPAARIWVAENVFRVKLYRWQRREFYAVGGRRRPRRGYVQVGRKNGKTAFAVLFILTEMVLVEESAIYAAADSERNLNSALVRELRTLIGRSQAATDAFIVTQKGCEYPHNGSFFEVRPGTFAATQSINPTLVVMDEVHMQKNDEIWSGFQMSGAASGFFLLLGITTPGYDLTSYAHELYQLAKAGDPKLYARIFEPDDPFCELGDREAWAQSNPRVEDDPAFIDAMTDDFESLPEHEFRRFRLGQWTATASAWLPYQAWENLGTGRKMTPGDLAPDQRVYLGFDGSYAGDSTALYGWTRDPATGKLHGFVAGCWENPGHPGWRVPRSEVGAVVAAWMGANRYVTLLADPPYWGAELSEWTQRWPNRVLEFPTHSRARMAPACTTFYAMVIGGELTHDSDPRMARHVSNCVVKSSPQGDVITKAQKNSPAKIDLAVASVVALSLAAQATRQRSPAGAR